MATHDDVRRIAATLPGAFESSAAQFGFSVMVKGKAKGFLWGWMERIHPKKPRVVNNDVLAIVVPNLDIKEILLNIDESKIFTEPHYNNYPAVLVHLANISAEELEPLVIDAWRTKASPDLVRQYDAQ